MPTKSADLHGFAPDSSAVVLLIIDMLSSMDAHAVPSMLTAAKRAAAAIARLKQRATAAGVPTLYVNDNAGRWQSAGARVAAQNATADAIGAPIFELLQPNEADYLVLKPKHSGFYQTPLALLLEHLNAEALILTGMSTHQCVLFTAIDAYVRDFAVYVPADCVASPDSRSSRMALQLMQTTLNADIRASTSLRLPALLRRHHRKMAR